tara:strand:+ start:141 stop:554 length:414 start_codon:yes stop_codon:yes gene_type:complete
VTVTKKKKTTTLSSRGKVLRERRLRELEMRKAGLTYAQIADAVGVSVKTVSKDIRSIVLPNANFYDLEIAVDLQRIEMALLPLAKAVRDGEHKAIDRWKQLIDTKHKLLNSSLQDQDNQKQLTLPVKVVSEVELEKI